MVNNGTRGKTFDLEEIVDTLGAEKRRGRKVVHCHGVFDLLHIGHIRHLEQAKGMGDVLVVTVTPDRYVNKGPSRPVFTETLRAEAIAALDCVDYVAINRWPIAEETIKLLRPDYYVKGPDYMESQDDRTGGISKEEAAVQSVGGQIAFTDDITFSSSNLINKHLQVHPRNVGDYLDRFSSRHSTGDVLRYLDGAESLKVLVVGETIIDEYVYCEAMGKSGKEPVLAVRRVEGEKFAGGIIAVANHVSAFSNRVGLLTFLGGQDSQEEFIDGKIEPNVERMFLYLNGGAPTIVKRRYVEVYPRQNLFEVYVMDHGDAKTSEAMALTAKLEEVLPQYDVVIVTDYGHGMLGPEAVKVLASQSRFLAINTQVNADNRGFNTVSKYPRADYVCVSENEIRLEARSRLRDLRDVVLEVSEKLSCSRITVTRGQQGCLCYSEEEGFFEVPAFASQVVDRMGAGDTVLSVTALCVAQGAPTEVVGLIANAAGAEAVATVGHRTSLQRVSLLRHIESLLK